MNGNHLKYMLLGGAGLFGVLLVVGVPLTSALLFAVVLACPLMMFTMGGRGPRWCRTRPHVASQQRAR